MNKAKKKLVEAAKKKMEREGIKQRELAKKLGLQQPRVSEILNGEREKTTWESIFRVLEALGVRWIVSAIK